AHTRDTPPRACRRRPRGTRQTAWRVRARTWQATTESETLGARSRSPAGDRRSRVSESLSELGSWRGSAGELGVRDAQISRGYLFGSPVAQSRGEPTVSSGRDPVKL